MRKLESIQALRGIAALSVFFFHLVLTANRYAHADVRPWIDELRAGVDLFFVISGFVMAHSVRALDGPRDAAIFVIRRLWRIAPPLYLLSLAYIGVCLIYGIRIDTARIVNSFTILPVMRAPGRFQCALIPAWTLAFEMTFYLLVAMVVASRLKQRFVGLIVATAVVALFFVGPIMLEFSFGVAAYWLWANEKIARWTVIPGLATAALVIALGTNLPRVMAWGIPAASVFSAALLWRTPPRSLLWLGEVSYSLYLSHVVVFDALAPVFAPMGAITMCLVLAPIGLIIAWLIYESVERPLLASRGYRAAWWHKGHDCSQRVSMPDEPAAPFLAVSPLAAAPPPP